MQPKYQLRWKNNVPTSETQSLLVFSNECSHCWPQATVAPTIGLLPFASNGCICGKCSKLLFTHSLAHYLLGAAETHHLHACVKG